MPGQLGQSRNCFMFNLWMSSEIYCEIVSHAGCPTNLPLTLKRQSRLQQTTFKNIFQCFSEKIRLDVSSESSAGQRIHMKKSSIIFFES